MKIIKLFFLLYILSAVSLSNASAQTPGYRGNRFYVMAKISGHPSFDQLREYPEEPWNFDKWAFKEHKLPAPSMLYGLSANYVTGRKSVLSLDYQFSRTGGIVVRDPDATWSNGSLLYGRANFHLINIDLKLFLYQSFGIQAPLGVYFSAGAGVLMGSSTFIHSTSRELVEGKTKILMPCMRPGLGVQRIFLHKLMVNAGMQANISLPRSIILQSLQYSEPEDKLFTFAFLKNFLNAYISVGVLLF